MFLCTFSGPHYDPLYDPHSFPSPTLVITSKSSLSSSNSSYSTSVQHPLLNSNSLHCNIHDKLWVWCSNHLTGKCTVGTVCLSSKLVPHLAEVSIHGFLFDAKTMHRSDSRRRVAPCFFRSKDPRFRDRSSPRCPFDTWHVAGISNGPEHNSGQPPPRDHWAGSGCQCAPVSHPHVVAVPWLGGNFHIGYSL